MKTPSFLKSKKFKYGTVSTAVMVMFIAVVLVANIVVSSLADRNAWYIDMTDEQVFTLSDAAKSLLDTLEHDVTVIFAADRDKIESDFSSFESGKAMAYIYNTVKLMSVYSDHVKIEYHDCERNPTYFDQFTDLSALVDGTFNSDYVIIKGEDKNGDEPGGFEYRVRKDTEFYYMGSTTSETYAYNGELVFVSSFLQVALEENPVVCFTTGHGEDLDMDKYANLVGVFDLAGFETRVINLAEEDIPAETRMLVINNPRSDFPGYNEALNGDVDQIQKVSDYLNNVGSVMYFTDYRYASELTNLNDLLKLWNIEIQSGVYVQDTRSSTGDAAQIIRVDYNEDSHFASQLLSTAVGSATFAKPVMSYATPITILNGGYKAEALRSLTTESLLVSGSTSKLVNSSNSSDVLGTGSYNVMAMTYSKMYDESDNFSSYLLVCGSSTFANNAYCEPGATYPNWDILMSFVNTATRYQVPVNIDYKVFQSYDLDITSYQADMWTLALTLVLPAISVICGAIVLVRRKYA